MRENHKLQVKIKNSKGVIKSSNTPSSIVGIGTPAGKLRALEQFFTNIPVSSNVAFVIVQHGTPNCKNTFIELLKKYTDMKVLKASDGLKIRPDCVYITLQNNNIAVINGTFQMLQPLTITGRNFPIDFFLRSLAEDQKERAVGIIFSGIGTDGILGIKTIKEKNGMVMVQSPEKSNFNWMLKKINNTISVDCILPPDKMPQQLINYVLYAHYMKKKKNKNSQPGYSNYLQKILIYLKDQTGYDFSYYKLNTISPKINKRMIILKIVNISDYFFFLQENPKEIKKLFRELLNGFTKFFRDTGAFEILKNKVIPFILHNKPTGSPIRIWVPGCSTGEEAYSIAMILKEFMEQMNKEYPIQVFATDVDSRAIKIARTGIYPENIILDVSKDCLNRFFVKHYNTYQIKKEIRDMVVFSVHNLVNKPPFLKLDMISCRNLMNYLDISIHKRVLRLFNNCLNTEGFLFLGSSETVDELFTVFDEKWEFYKCNGEKRGINAAGLSNDLTSFNSTQHLQTGKNRNTISSKSSHKNYADLYEFSPAGCFNFDSEGTIQNVNFTGAGMLGEKKEALIEMHFSYYIDGGKEGVFFSHLMQVFKSKGTQTCELRLKRKNGMSFQAQLQSIMIKDSKRHLNFCQTVLTDIIRLKQAEEESAFFRNLIEHINDAMFVVDPETLHVIDVNLKACDSLGYAREELLTMKNMYIEGFLLNEFFWKEHIKKMKPGESKIVNGIHIRKNGTVFPIEVSLSYVKRNMRDYVIVIARDISSRNQSKKRKKLMAEILSILNFSNKKGEIINKILYEIKKFAGIETVGIRIREGEDFPYYIVRGFPVEFVRDEKYICAADKKNKTTRSLKNEYGLNDICGKVVTGCINPELPFFTTGGSFWTNNMSEIPEHDFQVCVNGRCGKNYKSVALIPMRSAEGIIGFLQLNDSRINCFTQDMIEFLEEIGVSIGMAFVRESSREAIEKSEEKYRTIFERAASMIITVDSEGNIVECNNMVKEILGYCREEVRGQPLANIIYCIGISKESDTMIRESEGNNLISLGGVTESKASARGARAPMEVSPKGITCQDGIKKGLSTILTMDYIYDLESKMVRKDGVLIDVSINSSALRHEKENYAETLLIINDITEHKQVEELQKKQKEMLEISERKNKEFSRKLLSIREEEKKNFSINLHDELGSMSIAVRASLLIAEENIIRKKYKRLLKNINEINKLFDESLGRLRKITRDLRTPYLDVISLPEALKELIAYINRSEKVKVKFSAAIAENKVNKKIAVVLYKVVQEAFNNIIQHACARNAKIMLYLQDGSIKLDICDDGKGFDIKELEKKTEGITMGIQGMKERVGSLGGEFIIESVPGIETRISVTLPKG